MQKAKSHVVMELAKHVKLEMKNLCSMSHNSILRDQHDGLKCFNWDSVWVEFQHYVPTLLKFLQCLMPKAERKLISFMAAMIVKRRCKHMCLVQRVISTLLYGNATHKEVNSYNMLPLMHYFNFINFRCTGACNLL